LTNEATTRLAKSLEAMQSVVLEAVQAFARAGNEDPDRLLARGAILAELRDLLDNDQLDHLARVASARLSACLQHPNPAIYLEGCNSPTRSSSTAPHLRPTSTSSKQKEPTMLTDADLDLMERIDPERFSRLMISAALKAMSTDVARERLAALLIDEYPEAAVDVFRLAKEVRSPTDPPKENDSDN
jgi:hypothetical protein